MSEPAADRFGNWLTPRSPGLFGLSLPALLAAGGGVMLALLMMIGQQFIGMLIVLLITAVVVGLGFVSIEGRTPLERAAASWSQRRRRASGESMYVTGALATLPADVAERLPGALVDVETISGRDGLDRPYSLLHHVTTGKLAAVFGCAPDGAAMQEQGVVNAQVANFGGWVSGLSVEDGLSGATIVVDSASEASDALIQGIRETAAPGLNGFAHEVMEAAMGTLPARTSTVNVYATLVYDVAELGGSKTDLSPAVAEVAARMPGHSQLLRTAGGGPVAPLVESELSRIAQLAYKPSLDREITLDELSGLRQERSFDHAGPGYLDDSSGRVVFHDGVASMTLMMTAPPGAHINARSLDRLFGPNPKFLRKRVAILYRPVDPGTGARAVDRQVRAAQWRMDTRRQRATSFDRAEKAVAEKTEQELAEGARLSLFSVMVTVTFEPTEKAYRYALNQVKSLLNQSLMEYRFVEHGGNAAFHTTLPFGILPWTYSRKPVWLEAGS